MGNTGALDNDSGPDHFTRLHPECGPPTCLEQTPGLRFVKSLRALTWGSFGDHTLCAIVNDLRVYAHLTRPQTERTLAVTGGNVLPQFTVGQLVEGSNPVSPTRVIEGQVGR
jgi:hypothetical protein